MLVDAREMLYLRKNLPYGMVKVLAKNIGMDYLKARNEFMTLKEEYPDDLVTEARRLLKETTGLEYTETAEA